MQLSTFMWLGRFLEWMYNLWIAFLLPCCYPTMRWVVLLPSAYIRLLQESWQYWLFFKSTLYLLQMRPNQPHIHRRCGWPLCIFWADRGCLPRRRFGLRDVEVSEAGSHGLSIGEAPSSQVIFQRPVLVIEGARSGEYGEWQTTSKPYPWSVLQHLHH